MTKQAWFDKRFKTYPPEHFTKWRGIVQRIIVRTFIEPILTNKYHPVFEGRENVPKKGPFLVAANHISLADPPLVAMAIQFPIAFMAKQELFENRFMAEYYRLSGCFALNREQPDLATMKTAFNVLKSNWAMGLFPEGTRSKDGKVAPFKKGLSQMAKKANVPILPIGIKRMPDGHFRLRIGKLIPDVSNPDAVHEEVYQALVTLTSD